jgi:Swt1-like HEPN
MTSSDGWLYDFAFRGLLAEEALDRAGRRHSDHGTALDEEIASALSLDLLDDELVLEARRMATVYTAIAAFENSVRKLIVTVLIEREGDDWWTKCVSEKIRSRAATKQAEETKVKWHAQRGADPIYYTQMGDLVSIIRQNWSHFEPHLKSVEWAAGILDVVERSRNVIMHSGRLDLTDIERIGIFIRDWIAQVGA